MTLKTKASGARRYSVVRQKHAPVALGLVPSDSMKPPRDARCA